MCQYSGNNLLLNRYIPVQPRINRASLLWIKMHAALHGARLNLAGMATIEFVR